MVRLRPALIVACLLAAAAPAVAGAPAEPQENPDFQFGQALADRGYYAVAEEVFQALAGDNSLSADQRTEGTFGLALLRVVRAVNTADPDQRRALSQQARQEIQQFLQAHPNHPNAGQAKSYLGFLMREDARALARSGRRDPSKIGEARQVLTEAEQMYAGEISRLGEEPEPGSPQFDAYTDSLFTATHELIVTRFTWAEVFEPYPELRDEVRGKYAEIIQSIDEFEWRYGDFLVFYDLATYGGRSAWHLALLSTGAEAQQWWDKAWTWFNAPVSLKDNADVRDSEDVPAIVGDGALWLCRAKAAFAEGHPADAVRMQHEIASLAQEVLTLWPDLATTESGKYLLIERASALMRTGQRDDARRILDDLINNNRNTLFEFLALDILSSGAGSDEPELILQAAEGMLRRGRLPDAAQRFRRAAQVLPSSDASRRADSWLKMGHCFYMQNLYLEAAACYSLILDDSALSGGAPQVAREAAVWRWRAARVIAQATGAAADQERLSGYERQGMQAYPDVFGAEISLQHAFTARNEGHFDETIELCNQVLQRVQPTDDAYVTALALLAGAHYRTGRAAMDEAQQYQSEVERNSARARGLESYRQALDAFLRHYRGVLERPDAKPVDLRNGLNSLNMATFLLSQARSLAELHDPARLLEATDGFLARFTDVVQQYPEARPWPATILRRRVEAVLETLEATNPTETLARLEQSINELEDYYDNVHAGLRDFQQALQRCSSRLEALARTAAQAQDTDAQQRFMTAAEDYFMRNMAVGNVQVNADRPDELWDIARYFFRAAEKRDDVEKYRQARELIENYLANAADIPAERMSVAQAMRATCYRREGQLDAAVEIVQRLTTNDPQRRNLPLWEELADCVRERAHRGGGNGRQDLEFATGVFGSLTSSVQQSRRYQDGDAQFQEAYWRVLYKYLDSLTEWNIDQAWVWFANRIRGGETVWDEGRFGFAPQFDELKNRIATQTNRTWPEAPTPGTTPAPETPPDQPPPEPAPPAEQPPQEGGQP